MSASTGRGNVFEGPLLELKVESFEGFFNQPRYRFLRNDAYGEADRVDFIDDKRAIIRNATYTTCQRRPGPSWMPDWILRATSIRIDEEEEVGQAEGAVLSFKGLPILPVPALSFPLSEKRKSGLLPPTFGLDNLNGIELTTPYYWNIAPNRDATFFPSVMSKRGVTGGRRVPLPRARLWRQAARGLHAHRQTARQGALGLRASARRRDRGLPIGAVGLNLNLNRVSDDNYWQDFSRGTVSLTQRLLSNDGALSWSPGNLSVVARAQKWQTLQDATAPIVPPYDRLPQLLTRYNRGDLAGGLETNIEADYTRFHADPLLTGQPNAQRGYALAQISRPWQAPGWFFTPKVQLHATTYQFDAPLRRTGPTRPTCRFPPSAWTAGWCSSATRACSAAIFARRWSRGLST